jgi:hypothetical protein
LLKRPDFALENREIGFDNTDVLLRMYSQYDFRLWWIRYRHSSQGRRRKLKTMVCKSDLLNNACL